MRILINKNKGNEFTLKRKAALIAIAMVTLLIMSSVALASSGKKWETFYYFLIMVNIGQFN